MQSFHLSTQGASHIKRNKECQDASASYHDDRCAIGIVCDGHGGDDYIRSANGSVFACAAAKENILSFIENVTPDDLARNHEQLIRNLNASIINAWNKAISEHCAANPFTEEELSILSDRAKRKYLQENRIEAAYGTTLIAVACTKDYWFGIHIGDGKCVAITPEEEFVQPIPWDDDCFLNRTTSICYPDALNRFRYYYSDKLPVAVFVGSDGVDDSLSAAQLNNLYKTVLFSFATSNVDTAVADLADYLPRLSATGSGDDVSIAAILDLDKIRELDLVKTFGKSKEAPDVTDETTTAQASSEATPQDESADTDTAQSHDTSDACSGSGGSEAAVESSSAEPGNSTNSAPTETKSAEEPASQPTLQAPDAPTSQVHQSFSIKV